MDLKNKTNNFFFIRNVILLDKEKTNLIMNSKFFYDNLETTAIIKN